MKIRLSRKINKETDLPVEEAVKVIQTGVSTKYQLFPDKIMCGDLDEGKFETLINPPFGWVDPFRSRVIGKFSHKDKLTIISLTVKPNSLTTGFMVIWYSLMILMILSFSYHSWIEFVEVLGISLIWAAFPFFLIRIKTSWDKRRLESWLNKRL